MPGEAYVTVRPMRALIGDQRRSWRLGAAMFMAFGVLALVVAAVGLYAVMGYDVTQRTHEMGVRIALGAQPRDLIRFVVGQGVRFALLGIGLGSALALVGSRWIEPLLFQQSATDPVVFGGVALVLVAVALLASSIPARRATQADPNRALRTD
jgi:ABC-type antimicrobial peptide transport system permease subunit